LVSDGVDNSGKGELSDAIQSALQTDTAVYFVSLLHASSNPNTAPPLSYVREAQRTADELGKKTGGDIFFVRNQNHLRTSLEFIAAELRSEYLLGYYPTNMNKNGKFRKIKVQILGKGLQVQTRDGYYPSQQ
jgi:Ca-activated chloride channel family protein